MRFLFCVLSVVLSHMLCSMGRLLMKMLTSRVTVARGHFLSLQNVTFDDQRDGRENMFVE